MNDGPEQQDNLGNIVQDFVNRIAHRGGRTIAIMNEASVTLQQIIFLSRIAESRVDASSELSVALGMSLPAVSQMVDRLHRLGLLTRAENSTDRRKKQIALTQDGRRLLARLYEARSIEFEAGTARLSPQVRSDLGRLLRQAVQELDFSAGRARADGPLTLKDSPEEHRIPDRRALPK